MNREPMTIDRVVTLYRETAHCARLLADELAGDAESVITDTGVAYYRELMRDLTTCISGAEQRLVMHLRDTGASWTDVGDILGTTRQSAHERFSRYDRDSVPE